MGVVDVVWHMLQHAARLAARRAALPRLARPLTLRFASTAAAPPPPPVGSSSAPPLEGPLLPLEAAVAPVGEPVLHTVPVPILVGPEPAPVPGAVVDASSISADAATAAAMAKADVAAAYSTAGGWFFSKPMAAVEWVLLSVHETTGLPWWATIAVTTVSFRMAFAPMQIFQSKSVAKMSKIRPEMDRLSALMKAAAKLGTPKGLDDAEKHRLALAALLTHHGVRPWMTMVGALGQLPLWMTFFFSMRHLMRPDSGFGLETGGLLWFNDLTMTDPYYALPVLCSGTFFGMVHLGDAGQDPTKLDERTRQMKTMMKGVAVLMIPMTSWMESGVFVYWISTNIFGMSQTVLLRIPALRAAVGMPPLPAGAPQGLLGMSPAQAAAKAPHQLPLVPEVTYATSPTASRAPLAVQAVPKEAGRGKRKQKGGGAKRRQRR